MAGRLFGLVLPDCCRLCQETLREVSRVPVCHRCLSSLEPLSAEYSCRGCRITFLNDRPLDESGRCAMCRNGLNGFDAAYTFGAYQGDLRKLIHLFKYGRIETLSVPLGKLLMRALPLDRHFDMVTPMPMHWLRRWDRGFNQAEALAHHVAQRAGIPILRAARRVRSTPAQAGLSSAARRRNVAGVFQANQQLDLNGRRILLVDDVLTTGATAGACAVVLKRAGAAHVTVLTVARADRRDWVEPLRIGPGVSGGHFALGVS
ncbi:MAG: ComF family protein [Acidobacteriia bacterium]|nr:ComF family protein [Terriglobia bacterium]